MKEYSFDSKIKTSRSEERKKSPLEIAFSETFTVFFSIPKPRRPSCYTINQMAKKVMPLWNYSSI